MPGGGGGEGGVCEAPQEAPRFTRKIMFDKTEKCHTMSKTPSWPTVGTNIGGGGDKITTFSG